MRILFTLVILSVSGVCLAQDDAFAGDGSILITDPVPTFPGGMDSLKNYLKRNYSWTQSQLTVQGTSFVEFLVQDDGALTGIKIIKGLCESCDKEAKRLISEMPNWIPAIQNGIPVTTRMVLPIKFILSGGNPYESDGN
ncbi:MULTISPECIES: energy transducer TonB [unclassified Imperialibacter]|uniref:energy transducer TonB n=1 Tax=unclassified Imperialibacter TaxID=2629706 RepID=UPI00125963B4|nr:MULTISPECIES: energy transducer TonB [unclassified Imperialibacter]CAD5254456.1 exported hypothetical protein [Imperialibacter sp. 89]CAD5267352.1 exported hypothetical protein [Imperialibacter sp. 75]VVT00902.1 Conserved transporter (modular protein) [Imperialibacter sp. EC-SDR9]